MAPHMPRPPHELYHLLQYIVLIIEQYRQLYQILRQAPDMHILACARVHRAALIVEANYLPHNLPP